MALLEAMAAGLPIIATRVGAVPEALGYGTAGELVEPSDESSLAGQIGVLLKGFATTQSPVTSTSFWEPWAARGLVARRRFEEAYTADAMVAQYGALYLPTMNREQQ